MEKLALILLAFCFQKHSGLFRNEISITHGTAKSSISLDFLQYLPLVTAINDNVMPVILKCYIV